MENTTIARPYAEAVFRLADQKGNLPAWSKMLDTMAQVAANPDMQACIGNPKIARGQLVEWFLSLCTDVSEGGRNLVVLMADNGRLALMPQVCEQFEQLKNEREGVLEAQIFTAFPLDQGQQSSLIADLEKKFSRRINATVALDPELIGGVKVVVGDKVIDASVRAKLAAMDLALKS
ncbi:MAG TPA: F0F1 ATP synthase subunit delta [Rhodocyclaceae bacterium]|nr:F0F1 ATP synthase subunit delta [Rhodocyclaceae bacterium]